jgi:hypothetical protein
VPPVAGAEAGGAAGRDGLVAGADPRRGVLRGVGLLVVPLVAVPLAAGAEPADGAAWVGRTAEEDGIAPTTGMLAPSPAFLSTTFAPNDATKTASTVPATQAVRPTTTRIMSAI